MCVSGYWSLFNLAEGQVRNAREITISIQQCSDNKWWKLDYYGHVLHWFSRFPSGVKLHSTYSDNSKNKIPRGKFIAIQAYIKKQETSRINNLTLHLKQLEKEEQKNPKASRRKEIIKIRSEINEKEMKETIAKSMKLKAGSSRR